MTFRKSGNVPLHNTDSTSPTGNSKVAETALSLWSANIPYLGLIAVHHWFVIERPDRKSRWEVWQSADAGGTSWGHVHRDLMGPYVWPHRDEPIRHGVWQGNAAELLIKRIETSPAHYPWLNLYRYWPGPNSNTYVQWVLQQDFRLGWKAVGKGYSRLA